jgi:hypothetical protein
MATQSRLTAQTFQEMGSMKMAVKVGLKKSFEHTNVLVMINHILIFWSRLIMQLKWVDKYFGNQVSVLYIYCTCAQ